MSATQKIACVDLGGTKGLVQVFGPGNETGITDVERFDVTKEPNDFEVDYVRLCMALDRANCACGGFDAISIGVAGRLKNGFIASAGKLHGWIGKSVIELLQVRYGVPVLVDNDGAMLTAAEIVFGVLADSYYQGRSTLVVAPGTGVAVCLALWMNDTYIILPGEGAHMTVDMRGSDTGATCCGQRNCVETSASGRTLEAGPVSPDRLSDEEVAAVLAPSLGGLVRNVVDLLPNIDVVVMSGGIAHKRPSLVTAVADAAAQQLNGVIPTPEFVLSRYETGGLLGCLARWMIANPQG